jgi:lipopolysaccharide export system permease protein
MVLLQRYLFKTLLTSCLMITAALSGAVWLSQSLRYVDFVIARGLPLWRFLQLVSLLLPTVLATVLPIGFFLAALFVFYRFYSDRELTVLRAVGMDNGRLMAPLYLLAGIVTLTLYGINVYVHPLTTQRFKDFRSELKNNITRYMIQPGTFSTFKNTTVYVRSQTRSGDVRGIFIYDKENDRNPTTITAEKGHIYDQDNGLRVILFNGTRQSVDPKTHRVSALLFQRYSIDVKNPPLKEDKGPQVSLSFLELLKGQEMTDRLWHKRRVEAHLRMLLPLLTFLFASYVGLTFLRQEIPRRLPVTRLVLTGIGGLMSYVLLVMLMNMSDKIPLSVSVAYGLVLGGIALTYGYIKKGGWRQ